MILRTTTLKAKPIKLSLWGSENIAKIAIEVNMVFRITVLSLTFFLDNAPKHKQGCPLLKINKRNVQIVKNPSKIAESARLTLRNAESELLKIIKVTAKSISMITKTKIMILFAVIELILPKNALSIGKSKNFGLGRSISFDTELIKNTAAMAYIICEAKFCKSTKLLYVRNTRN